MAYIGGGDAVRAARHRRKILGFDRSLMNLLMPWKGMVKNMENWKKGMVFLSAVIALSAARAGASMARTRLGTVTDPYWSNTSKADGEDYDEGSYAKWDEVEDACEYEIWLYMEGDSGSSNYVAKTKTKKTFCSLRGKMKKRGDYYFKVRALAKKEDKEFSDGAWSEYSPTFYAGDSLLENAKISDKPYASPYGVSRWTRDDIGWKYQGPNGAYPSGGWFQDPENQQWFYLDGAGYARTGWVEDHGKWYFCDPGSSPVGAMVTGKRMIDGVDYSFDVGGALVGQP